MSTEIVQITRKKKSLLLLNIFGYFIVLGQSMRRCIHYSVWNMSALLYTSGPLPQEHLAGSTVGVLIECVHLEVMLIGRGSLWLDVGPGSK